jgi:hypothetical protein
VHASDPAIDAEQLDAVGLAAKHALALLRQADRQTPKTFASLSGGGAGSGESSTVSTRPSSSASAR